MNDDGTCNGWLNYATWNVALHVGNNEGIYHAAADFMAQRSQQNHGMISRSQVESGAYREFIEENQEWLGKQTPDNAAWLGRSLDYAALDEMMFEFISENREPVDITPDGAWECPRCAEGNEAAADDKVVTCSCCEWEFAAQRVPFTVDVIASGYQWGCPVCGRFNGEIEYTEEVTCQGCGTACVSSPAEHAYG